MDIQKYFSKVFIWMFIGLAITFLTGQVVAVNKSLSDQILGMGYWVVVVAELVTVIVLSVRIQKMSPIGAKIAFILVQILFSLPTAIVKTFFIIF